MTRHEEITEATELYAMLRAHHSPSEGIQIICTALALMFVNTKTDEGVTTDTRLSFITDYVKFNVGILEAHL